MEFETRAGVIKVLPEYTSHSFRDYASMRGVTIGGLNRPFSTEVIFVDRGTLIGRRRKTHLTSGEKERGMAKGQKIYSFMWNDLNILPLLCYEICFPEDYYHLENIDLVTHHVGFPMYDKDQLIAWNALQKAAVNHFKCPLVCACGGELSKMNLTGVIKFEE